jgi:hypothetical protein
MADLFIVLSRNAYTGFGSGCTSFYFQQECMRSLLLWIFTSVCSFLSFDYSHSNWGKILAHCGSHMHFSWWLVILRVFHIPDGNLHIFFWEVSKSFLHLLWDFCCWVFEFVMDAGYQSSVRRIVFNYFLPSLGSLPSVDFFFCLQNLLSFTQSNLFSLHFWGLKNYCLFQYTECFHCEFL